MKTTIIEKIKSINLQKENLKRDIMDSLDNVYKYESFIYRRTRIMLNKLSLQELENLNVMINTSK